MRWLILFLFPLVFIATADGLLLNDGECYNASGIEICSQNCTAVDEESCHELIEDAIWNRTWELEDWCLTMQNISDLINSTYGKISEGYMDECRKWEAGSEKWEEQWRICDDQLHDERFMESRDTIEELESENSRLSGLYNRCDDDLEDTIEQRDYAQSNMYTSSGLSLLIGLGLMWFFKVRKKQANVEGQPDSYETVEGY